MDTTYTPTITDRYAEAYGLLTVTLSRLASQIKRESPDELHELRMLIEDRLAEAAKIVARA